MEEGQGRPSPRPWRARHLLRTPDDRGRLALVRERRLHECLATRESELLRRRRRLGGWLPRKRLCCDSGTATDEHGRGEVRDVLSSTRCIASLSWRSIADSALQRHPVRTGEAENCCRMLPHEQAQPSRNHDGVVRVAGLRI
jgi:hypothetical protein